MNCINVVIIVFTFFLNTLSYSTVSVLPIWLFIVSILKKKDVVLKKGV